MSLVVTFDLDDTLCSERDYVESGLRAAGDEIDRHARLHGSGEALWKEWLETRRPDVFQRLLSRLGLPEDDWLPLLRTVYREHMPKLHPRAGVSELLRELRVGGHRIALISDGAAGAQRLKWQSL